MATYERRQPQLGDPWEPHTCCMPDCDQPRTLGGPLACDRCRPHMDAAPAATADALASAAVTARHGRPDQAHVEHTVRPRPPT